jgi:hypothetical protein
MKPDRESRKLILEDPDARRGNCPACLHSGTLSFYRLNDIPVFSSKILDTQMQALDVPRGDLELHFCPHCGFVTNSLFDPQRVDFSAGYEDQQSFSPTFARYAREMATHLISTYGLHNKTVVEIGSGKADFLSEICRMGSNQGYGIDPSSSIDRISENTPKSVSLIRDVYSEKYSKLNADLICCRHTLEHILNPFSFMQTIITTLAHRPHSIVFFEVPDLKRIIDQRAFWDIYYEHCSYFTTGSLGRLFQATGFNILSLSAVYENQYLAIEAQPSLPKSYPSRSATKEIKNLQDELVSFSQEVKQLIRLWQKRLFDLHTQGKKVIIWWSGAKCMGFLTALGDHTAIEYVVDINPHRSGKYMPGLPQEIKPAKFISQSPPDVVVIMNSIYEDEIREYLKALNLSPLIYAL